MADKTVALDKKVPDFALPATGGTTWKLSGAQRAATSSCTSTRATIRPAARRKASTSATCYPQFKKARTEIVGVSHGQRRVAREVQGQVRFPFELLADEAQKACKLFDVIHEKSMYGRKFMGVVRSTFLIDADGVLRQEWRKVKITGHAQEVLAAARAL